MFCRKCGSVVRATDTRLCPYCGKLRDPFIEKCLECEDSYVPPDMRAPVITEKPPEEEAMGTCPNCGGRRPMAKERCPWCNTPALPWPEKKKRK